MAAKKTEVKNYCDALYGELMGMKTKLNDFSSMIENDKGGEKEVLRSYVHHLREMITFIDWKIEIFSKVCPVDWEKLNVEVESTVSVPPLETTKEKDLPAGGYVGG